MIEIEPIDSLALTLHHSPGVQALLLGSGISRSAGVPTGWEITLDLIRRLASVQGVTDEVDWAEWYRKKYGKEPSYSEILDSVATAPAERRSIIHSYIEATPGTEARQPTKAHHAIAQLVDKGAVKVILTTNFDRLLENALRDVGIEPTVIASDDAIVGAMPLVHSPCTIIKLHGDYMDARIKNTEDELQVYSDEMNKLLDRVLDEYGLVIAGWSGDWDPALRSAISRTKGRRFPFYWAARGTLSSLGNDLLVLRGGRLIPITDADQFFSELALKTDALAATRRPHPQSLASTLAEGKILCRDDKFSTEWADFVAHEVQIFRNFIINEKPKYNDNSISTFNTIVQLIISRSEILRRLTSICMRWGTDESTKCIIRMINEITFINERKDGYVYINSLNAFGASLCFHWGVAASIARDDYRRLATLMTMKIRGRHGKETEATLSLPADILDSINWNNMAGYENRKTAISDRMYDLFSNESADISLFNDEKDEIWDDSEIYITLYSIFLTECRADKIQQRHPRGRFMWRDNERLEQWFGKFNNINQIFPVLQAGLFDGIPGGISSAIEHFKSLRKQGLLY